MVIKEFDITEEILLEVLQLALISGQRSYCQENNVEPTEGWEEQHMFEGIYWTDKIREKLNIKENYIIGIDYENCKLLMFDEFKDNNTYDNNIK